MRTDTTSPSTAAVGTVYLPTSGQGVGTFEFVVDRDHGADVQIGSAVAGDTTEGTVIGVVVDMRVVGHASDPHVADRMAGSTTIDARHPVLVATVQVFNSEKLRPTLAGPVRAANADEVRAATGGSDLAWPIPAGCVELLGGGFAPVSLDGHSLVGPEAAHIHICGLSGQAAKSSFAGVLLASTIASGARSGESVGALLFNVKGTDLLFLENAPQEGAELTADDLALYEALGTPAEPFADVTYYAPADAAGHGARSVREDATALCWDLGEVWDELSYMMPDTFEDENFSTLLAVLREKYIKTTRGDRVRSIDQLISTLQAAVRDAEEEGQSTCLGGLHLATVRKGIRVFSGIGLRLGGLIARRGIDAADTTDVPLDKWRHGQVVVVDVASLQPDAAGFVIARTVKRLLREAEESAEGLGVDHLVVAFDEANQYAPATGGRDTRAVKRVLQKLVTTGRYAGISAWLAAQKASKLDELIRDQAATAALGRCAPAEVASGVYGRIPAGLAEQIVTLPRGRMMLWHHTLRAPIAVRFPRPAWQTGKARTGVVAADTLSKLDMSAGSVQLVRDAVGKDRAQELLDSSGGDVEILADELRRRGPRGPSAPAVDFDPDDPFALG
jgi:hypothetical protein